MKPATTMPTGPFRMAGRRTVATTASKSLAEPRSSSDASTTDRLDPRLRAALRHGPEALQALVGAGPSDHRDGVLALLRIHDLHLSPLASVSGTVRWQSPSCRRRSQMAARRSVHEAAPHPGRFPQLESASRCCSGCPNRRSHRQIPRIYEWLADHSSSRELIHFIALEGGPDGGFDDLVAICQIGLKGEAKLELARNYWDEMGRGHLADVHTELHKDLTSALDLQPIPRRQQPLESLERPASRAVRHKSDLATRDGGRIGPDRTSGRSPMSKGGGRPPSCGGRPTVTAVLRRTRTG